MRIRSAVLLLVLVLVGQVAAAESPRGGAALERRVSDSPNHAPTLPVILDGVEYPAGRLPATEAARFFVLTAEDQEKGVMHAFSSGASAAAFMRFREEAKHGEDGSVQEAVGYCSHPYIYSVFNKNRGGGGSDNLQMVKLPPPNIGERYPNLDFDGWNNTISYVAAACVTHWTTLYSCRNFDLTKDYFCESPAILFIEGGLIVPDLVPHGFNNRTSSIRFCRFPYDEPWNGNPCIEE